MPFSDPRIPGKEYKSQKALNAALRYYERQEAKVKTPAPDPTPEPQTASAKLREEFQLGVPEPAPLDHIRNIHGGPVRIRLTGEKREDSRSIRLQGRGQRGDTVAVTEAERRSADYANNIGLLFEAITTAEADLIRYNQTTNQQSVHPTIAALRNENGQPMSANGVVVKPEFNQQGVTVATEVMKENGKVDIQRVTLQRAMPKRAALPGTEDRPAQSYIRDNINEREREIISDQVARSRAEGPEAGLAGFTVRQPERIIDPALRPLSISISGSEQIR